MASPAVPGYDLTDTHDHSPLDSPQILVIRVPSPTSQPARDEEHPKPAVTESLEQSEWEQGHSELPGAPSPPHLVEYHQPQVPPEPVSPEGATEPTPTWGVSAPVE